MSIYVVQYFVLLSLPVPDFAMRSCEPRTQRGERFEKSRLALVHHLMIRGREGDEIPGFVALAVRASGRDMMRGSRRDRNARRAVRLAPGMRDPVVRVLYRIPPLFAIRPDLVADHRFSVSASRLKSIFLAFSHSGSSTRFLYLYPGRFCISSMRSCCHLSQCLRVSRND